MNPFKAVWEFNRTVIGIKRDILSPLHESEARFIVGSQEEEAIEFIKAWNEDNIPAQVDALIDSLYFTIGGLVRLGLTPKQMEKCFMIVHNANMQKVKGKKEEREVTHDLDAIKPDDWKGPEGQIEETLNGDTK